MNLTLNIEIHKEATNPRYCPIFKINDIVDQNGKISLPGQLFSR